ncbi:hypothetical protein L228DRAFT_230989, partial [Xylona heveae TC161]
IWGNTWLAYTVRPQTHKHTKPPRYSVHPSGCIAYAILLCGRLLLGIINDLYFPDVIHRV